MNKNENIILEKYCRLFTEITWFPAAYIYNRKSGIGEIKLIIHRDKLLFRYEIREEIFPGNMAPLRKLADQYPRFIVMAERISKQVKESLRSFHISFIESKKSFLTKSR